MMKATFCLILATLLTIIHSGAFAQQNQSTQKPNTEIETLEKRILALENQLQTVENVEKMKLAAELADANAKLRNAEIDKYKRELKDSNDEWLKTWTNWFLTIIAIFVAILIGVSAIFGYWLRSKANQLIADEVEKSLNGFKEAVGNLNEIKNQLAVLEDRYTYTVLQNFNESYFRVQDLDFKEIKALREEALLRICDDNTYLLEIRFRAVAVLADRKSPRLVFPTLKLINSLVNLDLSSDLDFIPPPGIRYTMPNLVIFVGQIHTQESYEELKKFLISLVMDNPKNKDWFLTNTAFSLSWVSFKLNKGDSVSVLRLAIPHLQVGSSDLNALTNFARYFDVFNAPEGIKEILTHHAAGKISELEDECLELLEKYDPEFVKKWKAEKETAETETEESL